MAMNIDLSDPRHWWTLVPPAIVIVSLIYSLVMRSRQRNSPPRDFTAQFGDYTYGGRTWTEDGVIHVTCDAGSRSTTLGSELGPGSIAGQLLIDIYRDAGKLKGD